VSSFLLLSKTFLSFTLNQSNVCPRYNPQGDGLGERITVREMINPNDPVKNAIICMSDLHLDSIWCKKENERIQTFIKDLSKIAKVR